MPLGFSRGLDFESFRKLVTRFTAIAIISHAGGHTRYERDLPPEFFNVPISRIFPSVALAKTLPLWAERTIELPRKPTATPTATTGKPRRARKTKHSA